jgi:hypothetical protein
MIRNRAYRTVLLFSRCFAIGLCLEGILRLIPLGGSGGSDSRRHDTYLHLCSAYRGHLVTGVVWSASPDVTAFPPTNSVLKL